MAVTTITLTTNQFAKDLALSGWDGQLHLIAASVVSNQIVYQTSKPVSLVHHGQTSYVESVGGDIDIEITDPANIGMVILNDKSTITIAELNNNDYLAHEIVNSNFEWGGILRVESVRITQT